MNISHNYNYFIIILSYYYFYLIYYFVIWKESKPNQTEPIQAISSIVRSQLRLFFTYMLSKSSPAYM